MARAGEAGRESDSVKIQTEIISYASAFSLGDTGATRGFGVPVRRPPRTTPHSADTPPRPPVIRPAHSPLNPTSARLSALDFWLRATVPGRAFTLAPASSDASFRRYFRVSFDDGSPAQIVMDAPPAHEDCAPFVTVAALLRNAGVNAPQVLAQDLAQGFLLVTDLGHTTYLTALQADAGRADALYKDAVSALIRLQLASQPGVLPVYDRTLLLREMQLLPEWYIGKHKGFALNNAQRNVIAQTFETLLANNLAQPCVYVHRDYHSRNLMVCVDNPAHHRNPGVLDFQDAVYGPITYDLASLFRDAYIEWEEERVLDWVIRYWEAARKAGLPVPHAFDDFYRDFEWMGLQRHLKVLGIFARLYHRDGKDGYLKDLPLVLHYVRKVCGRYGVFVGLYRLLHEIEQIETRAGYTF